MNLNRIHPNTCPLCQRRALALDNGECHCASCASVFAFDQATKLCCYTHIAPQLKTRFGAQFSQVENALLGQWLTRQQVFDIAAAETPPQSRKPRSVAPGPWQPSLLNWGYVLWMGGIALLTLCVLGCGVLWFLWIGPEIALRRSAVAPASTSALAPPTIFASAFNSPVPRPNTESIPQTTPLPQTGPLPTAQLSLQLKPLPTIAPPRAVPVPPVADPLASPLFGPTVILPPTFTPRPLVLTNIATVPVAAAAATAVLVIASPTTSNATVVIIVTPSIPGSATAIPIITVTTQNSVNASASIRISTLNFLGDANLKEADEFVELYNTSTQALSLKGWTIGLKGNEKLALSALASGFVIQAGQKCRIYTNSPPLNSECGPLSFNKNAELWPNNGGIVELRDPNDKLVDQLIYPK